jgi:DNA-directed RNA polymerase specialized sigma24 family protein
MDFDVVHQAYANEIQRLAYRQQVPGMDPDDVANEMLIVLWKASRSFKAEQGSFGTYWWSLWLNRRSDIAEAYHARKRVKAIPTGTVPDTVVYDPLPLLPPTSDPVEAMVWRLLAAGETGQDTRVLTEMSRRRYYDLLASWRTEEVRDGLID